MSSRLTTREKKNYTYKVKLCHIEREIQTHTVNGRLKIRYKYKDPYGRFETEMIGRYDLESDKIIIKKFILIEDGHRYRQPLWKREICRPYPGSLSYICREYTRNHYNIRQLIEYKPENAWTKCEIFYKGRWVKAHTVRECIELKGRLEFCDCE